MTPSDHLLEMIRHGIDVVRPDKILPEIFSQSKFSEVDDWLRAAKRYLLCIGKASFPSTDVILSRISVEDHFLISNPNPAFDVSRFHVQLGSHPLPDEKSLYAAQKLLDWISQLPHDAHLLIVLSGGASAMMVHPVDGISLPSKISVNKLLLRSGATIQEMNTVRKHLSRVKGGRLGQLLPKQKVVVLVISDVIGDDLSTIGSGPFYPDSTTFEDARKILERYGIWNKIPQEVQSVLKNGIEGRIEETPKAGSFNIPHYIIASNEIAQHAAANTAKEFGYHILPSPQLLSGLVEECATKLSDLIRSSSSGTALIAGGEATVRLKGSGVGGRNQHLALLLTKKLAGTKHYAACAGTDGIDGNSPSAGAWTDGLTLNRAKELNLDFARYAETFDSYNFFRKLGQNILTGPTGTNVMDLYFAIVG